MIIALTMSNVGQISSWAPADSLEVSLSIYQMGLLQVQVKDPSETFSRFKISDYDVGVEWSTLKAQTMDDTTVIPNPDYLVTKSTNGVDIT